MTKRMDVAAIHVAGVDLDCDLGTLTASRWPTTFNIVRAARRWA